MGARDLVLLCSLIILLAPAIGIINVDELSNPLSDSKTSSNTNVWPVSDVYQFDQGITSTIEDIEILGDGSVIFSGCSNDGFALDSLITTKTVGYVAKRYANGTIAWANGWYSTEEDVYDWDCASGIEIRSDGDIWVSGISGEEPTFGNITVSTSTSSNHALYRCWVLAKISSDGDWIDASAQSCWQNNQASKNFVDLLIDSNDNPVLVGNLGITTTQGQLCEIVKYNQNLQQVGHVSLTGQSWMSCYDAAISSTNEIILTGTGGYQFGGGGVQCSGENSSYSSASISSSHFFVFEINSNMECTRVKVPDSSARYSYGYSVTYDSNDDILLGFKADGLNFQIGNITYTQNIECHRGFIAKLNRTTFNWEWGTSPMQSASCNFAITQINEINGTIFFSADYNGATNISGYSISGSSSQDAVIGAMNSNGSILWASLIGGSGNELPSSLISTNENVIYAVFTSNSATVNINGQTNIFSGKSIHAFFLQLSSDLDGDGYGYVNDAFPNEYTQHSDLDGDGYGDNGQGYQPDGCPFQSGNSTHDMFGCLDIDGDGYSNIGDAFPNEPSQVFDTDSDGYGDNDSGLFGDDCPTYYGESFRDSYGCPDSDFDGWSDDGDDFPQDNTQWNDSDGDGYGNQLNGIEGDSCPNTLGNSTQDRFGCIDSDGDGYSDYGDDIDNDPTQHIDKDGDGYGDNPAGNNYDEFPNDATQSKDTDKDGYGDNPFGNQGDGCLEIAGNSTIDVFGCPDDDGDGVSNSTDAFPNDASRWKDSDDDGYGDEEDPFPFNPSQWADRDGDGAGDNERGSNADRFPDDPSQWTDIDGDGYGDNESGNNSDAFVTDATQWVDRDGDGYGDNPFGNGADMFPDDSSQWADQDEDGLGDNPEGNNPDPYLLDFDNDGYNDSIDILPKLASPGDIDNDGCMDEVDVFPLDYRECSDFDGDGDGDNADTDDDNDGWTDTDEIREDTNPFDASEYPIEAFQLMVPGTTIGLDGWDLIGIFGGVPLFAWILFGFVTRNARCRKFEKMLNGARTKKELENIALKSEYALMIRLLGPHQGIRLERLRAELDDALEGEGMPFDEDHTEVVEDEMAGVNVTEEIVEFDFDESPESPPAAIIAEGMSDGATPNTATPPPINTIGIVGQDGYEWLQQGGATWYRPANSGLDWAQWIQ